MPSYTLVALVFKQELLLILGLNAVVRPKIIFGQAMPLVLIEY